MDGTNIAFNLPNDRAVVTTFFSSPGPEFQCSGLPFQFKHFQSAINEDELFGVFMADAENYVHVVQATPRRPRKFTRSQTIRMMPVRFLTRDINPAPIGRTRIFIAPTCRSCLKITMNGAMIVR
jgi:hypothetical protein